MTANIDYATTYTVLQETWSNFTVNLNKTRSQWFAAMNMSPVESGRHRWNILNSPAKTGGGIAETGKYGTGQADNGYTASLPIKIYADVVSLGDLSQGSLNLTNNPIETKRQFVDPFITRMTSFIATINGDTLTATGGGVDVQGLLSSGGGLTSTGTYAGIDRATVPKFIPVHKTNTSTRDLTRALIADMCDTMLLDRDVKVTEIWCHQNQWLRAKQALTTVITRTLPVQDGVQTIHMSEGVNNFDYDGATFHIDNEIPDGTMIFMGSRQGIGIKYMQPRLQYMIDEPSTQAIARDVDPNFTFDLPPGQTIDGRSTLPITVYLLKRDGPMIHFAMQAMIQTQMDDPTTKGVLDMLTTGRPT